MNFYRYFQGLFIFIRKNYYFKHRTAISETVEKIEVKIKWKISTRIWSKACKFDCDRWKLIDPCFFLWTIFHFSYVTSAVNQVRWRILNVCLLHGYNLFHIFDTYWIINNSDECNAKHRNGSKKTNWHILNKLLTLYSHSGDKWPCVSANV